MTMSVADYARDCAAQGLRGDYSVCRSDFTVAQGYNYSSEEQAVWRTLCDRQTKLTQKLAHRSYLDGVASLGLLDRIPDFDEVSEKLSKLTLALLTDEKVAGVISLSRDGGSGAFTGESYRAGREIKTGDVKTSACPDTGIMACAAAGDTNSAALEFRMRGDEVHEAWRSFAFFPRHVAGLIAVFPR